MKVRELIRELSALDPELEVFIAGYEGGYERVTDISEPQDFILHWHSEWYYGPHELLKETIDTETDKEYKTTRGIFL